MNNDNNNNRERPAGRENDDELLTIREVADIVRAPIATLRYWRHLGTGPHSFRIGRGVRYWHHDVTTWHHDVTTWLHEQSNVTGRHEPSR